MSDAPENMAGLSRNGDTRKFARGDLVGVTGMASVEEAAGTDTIGHRHNWASVNIRGGHERVRP